MTRQEFEAVREACAKVADEKEAELARLKVWLSAIKNMKPTHIARGFVHGPQLLFDNCKRFAALALAGKTHERYPSALGSGEKDAGHA